MTDSTPQSRITVTVIMATFNRATYLAQALDSLLDQVRPADEIIVVDDGSIDETADVLARYQDRITTITQDNAGKPAALNRALATATGSHIWLFDDDDVALPGALDSHVRFLGAHTDIDFSCGRNHVFDGAGDIWQRQHWRPGMRADFSPDTLLLELMRQSRLVFQGLLVPRRCYETVGYFDESLLRCEDYDMLLRLARRFRGGDTGEMVFVWRNHGGERGPASERHTDAARARLFRKYERDIFRNVRNTLELVEYVPDRLPDSLESGRALSEEDRTRALLRRSDIMFRHDLGPEAASDLSNALEQIADCPSLAETARAIVARAADIDDPVFVDTAGQRARHLAWALRGPMRKQLAASATKGFYWSVRRALRRGLYRNAVSLMAAATVFWRMLAVRSALPRTGSASL